MAAFDQREWVYSRVSVNSVLEHVRIIGGSAWMYVARDEFVWRRPSRPPEAIIRRTYLDIHDRAHAELRDEFQREYDATTGAVPMHLVVDDIPG